MKKILIIVFIVIMFIGSVYASDVRITPFVFGKLTLDSGESSVIANALDSNISEYPDAATENIQYTHYTDDQMYFVFYKTNYTVDPSKIFIIESNLSLTYNPTGSYPEETSLKFLFQLYKN